MRYLPPFVVHSALGFRNEKEIQAQAQAYRQVIEGLRDGLLDPDEIGKHARINEAPSAVGLQDPVRTPRCL